MTYLFDELSTQVMTEARRADLYREADMARQSRMLRQHRAPHAVRKLTGTALIRTGSWIAGIAPEQFSPDLTRPTPG